MTQGDSVGGSPAKTRADYCSYNNQQKGRSEQVAHGLPD